MGALRILTILAGVGFTLQGIGWLIAPDRAATALGMPVLEGLARSTQFGDFAAFFLTLGLGILAGLREGQARILNFPAALLACAAFGRTFAWLFHGAAFAAVFIAVEIASSALLFIAARRLGKDG